MSMLESGCQKPRRQAASGCLGVLRLPSLFCALMRTPPQPPRGPTPPRGPASSQRGPAAAKPAAPKAAPRRPPRRLPAWLARAQRLLLSPGQEWQAIAAEFATPSSIYSRYILPMAAIGPIAATAGTIVYGFAVLIEVLAPSFGGQRNRAQALKVAAYSSTPYWLGGAVALFPKLSLIGGVLSLYSIRLLALGLPPLMKAPRDKSAAYTLLASIAGVILALIIGPLTGVVVGR